MPSTHLVSQKSKTTFQVASSEVSRALDSFLGGTPPTAPPHRATPSPQPWVHSANTSLPAGRAADPLLGTGLLQTNQQREHREGISVRN